MVMQTGIHSVRSSEDPDVCPTTQLYIHSVVAVVISHIFWSFNCIFLRNMVGIDQYVCGVRFAMVCNSNMNRSMEAHALLKRHGYFVDSYGTGSGVRIPGMMMVMMMIMQKVLQPLPQTFTNLVQHIQRSGRTWCTRMKIST